MDFAELAIGGVALIPVIMGLVEFSKKLGAQGKGLIVEAFGLGVLLAGVWGTIEFGLMPEPALPWVKVAAVALGGGVAALAAVGDYDLAKRLASRIASSE